MAHLTCKLYLRSVLCYPVSAELDAAEASPGKEMGLDFSWPPHPPNPRRRLWNLTSCFWSQFHLLLHPGNREVNKMTLNLHVQDFILNQIHELEGRDFIFLQLYHSALMGLKESQTFCDYINLHTGHRVKILKC